MDNDSYAKNETILKNDEADELYMMINQIYVKHFVC